jgi:hypothetical protein
MRILAIVIGALLVAGIGDWAAWTTLTTQLSSSFATWSSTMRAQGWRVRSGAPVSAGFPLAAVLIIPEFSISGGDNAVPAGIAWSADQVALGLGLAHPGRLSIEPQGRELLRISRSPTIAFTADRIAAWLPLARMDGPGSAHINLVADAIAGGIDGSHHPQDVRVDHLGLDVLVTRDGTGRTQAELHVDSRAVGLPDTGRWPLGATVAAFSAGVSLTSPSVAPTDPDDIDDGDAEDAATAWRDGNGQVTVHDLDLKWGPLSLNLQAQLGLDGQLQPTGHGKVRTEGYNEALDALSRGGTIPPGVAETAKAVLGLMGGAPADKGPGLDLPFTLKDSILSLGKIPLTKIKAVDWGRV